MIKKSKSPEKLTKTEFSVTTSPTPTSCHTPHPSGNHSQRF